MEVTYAMAMAAGRDAANRRMEKSGRATWNRADYNHAASVVEQLLGPPEENPFALSDLVARGIVGKSVIRRVRA